MHLIHIVDNSYKRPVSPIKMGCFVKRCALKKDDLWAGFQRLNRRRISQSKPRQIYSWLGRPAIRLVLGHYIGVNPAAHVPAGSYAGETWCNGRHDLVEYVVGDFFVERAYVAEAPHEHFQRFQLDAGEVCDVFNGEVRKIRLAGERAVAGELGNLDVNEIVPTRLRVREAVEGGLRAGLGAGLTFGHGARSVLCAARFA